MGAEHGPGRIPAVRIRIILLLFDDFSGVMTRLIPLPGYRQPASPSCVARNLRRIITKLRGWHRSLQNRLFTAKLRRLAPAVHLTDVRHCPAHIFRRNFQRHIQNRLQQNIFCHHQALPHSRVCRLPEITAGGVLLIGLSAEKADMHIRESRTGKYPLEALYCQLRENQVLPVALQRIRNAAVLERDPASRISRLQKKMNLRVMSQRFKVTYALHRTPDGFLIDNAARAELCTKIVLLAEKILQNLNLHRPHNPNGDVSGFLFLFDMEHRLLLLQLPKSLQQRKIIHRLSEAVCRGHAARHNRRQDFFLPVLLHAEAISRGGIGKPCCRCNFSCADAGSDLIPVTGIQAQLADLL